MIDNDSSLLEIRGLKKFFPGVTALNEVDFTLRSGEIHALLGENGAGKSTLIKVLTGVYPRDGGEIRLEGRLISPGSVEEAQRLSIGSVYQEVNLLPNISVAENLFLGRQSTRLGLVRRKAMRKAAAEILTRYRLDIDAGEKLGAYSVAVQQIVAIARAVDLSAKVLILDEPTASLDRGEAELLFEVMRSLKARGLGIIFITHFLDQVYEISDRITVLRNGCLVGEKQTSELPRLELVAMMLGRELNDKALKVSQGEDLSGREVVVRFENLGRKGLVEPFSLEIKAGEILGMVGLLGSGRTETAKVVFGITPADQGKVFIHGREAALNSPIMAIKQKFGYCPEDRKAEGIISGLSVRENMILAIQSRRGCFKPLARAESQKLAERFIKLLDIRPHDAEKQIQLLSGGNQQKVLLARWLATEPEFLILDEPTRGIDVGAHAEIITLIDQLRQKGVALMVISSELEEVVAYAGRVSVLRDHSHVKELAGGEVSVAGIIKAIAARKGDAHV